MESLAASLIEILLQPTALVVAVVACVVLLSGLAARVVEIVEGDVRSRWLRRTHRRGSAVRVTRS
jgi:hypothetical protein